MFNGFKKEGLELLSDFEINNNKEYFESKNGMGLEYEALEKWFYKSAQKHLDIIGWWLKLEDDY